MAMKRVQRAVQTLSRAFQTGVSGRVRGLHVKSNLYLLVPSNIPQELWNYGGRPLHQEYSGNLYRTHTAGELRAKNVGEGVRLAGWVNRRRDHGGLIFIDLRDRWGTTQVTFDTESAELFAAAESLRPEWSISVEGEVVRRPDGNENPELPTGDIEVSDGAPDPQRERHTSVRDRPREACGRASQATVPLP